MYPRGLWPLFALPGIVWLLLLFVVPFYAVMAVAFGTVDPVFQNPVPIWNPLDWTYGDALETLRGFLPGNPFWRVFLRTAEYVAAALALCLAIGYPVAYYISRHAGRTKSILVALLILPFWVSYLMRMLAWVNLLAPEGCVNTFLTWTHLVRQPPDWLNGNPYSVILGLTYGYIPFLILPLLAALDRIDKSVLEAARDLGASPFRAFVHVTLPLSKTGILGASVIVLLPMFGDYYTPNIVSGSPQTSMLGNQIDIYFHGGPQPAIGASLTLILSLFLGVLMAYYTYTVAKASREARA
jgi:ABC-type spermidine/putrescine transport system permease subunit I